jgi:endoglucanase
MKTKSFARFLCAVLFIGALGVRARAQAAGPADFAFSQNQRLGRGLNILSADPVWKNPAAARMQARHFALIKAAGYGNVRIAINPFGFATDQVDFNLDPKFFVTLDWAVHEALKNGLMPIVDFHEHHAMGTDPLGKKKMFLAMWRQIAAHAKDYPPQVLFEICNEPNMKPEIWNELQEAARKIIRESNPSRTLIIGTINGNQIMYLQDLQLPEDDRNIIVAVHYYMPIQFTHQGAPWSKKNKDLKDIPWTATAAEQAAVTADFDEAQQWAQAHHRPLTLGEFGAYEKAAMPHRQIWTDFIARQAEKRNWSWSYWQFDSDFIAYDIDHDHWVQPIQDALVPPPAKR